MGERCRLVGADTGVEAASVCASALMEVLLPQVALIQVVAGGEDIDYEGLLQFKAGAGATAIACRPGGVLINRLLYWLGVDTLEEQHGLYDRDRPAFTSQRSSRGAAGVRFQRKTGSRCSCTTYAGRNLPSSAQTGNVYGPSTRRRSAWMHCIAPSGATGASLDRYSGARRPSANGLDGDTREAAQLCRVPWGVSVSGETAVGVRARWESKRCQCVKQFSVA